MSSVITPDNTPDAGMLNPLGFAKPPEETRVVVAMSGGLTRRSRRRCFTIRALM